MQTKTKHENTTHIKIIICPPKKLKTLTPCHNKNRRAKQNKTKK
jgi:hypothetical protein